MSHTSRAPIDLLPWKELDQTDSPPWSAVESIANAAVKDPKVCRRIMRLFNDAFFEDSHVNECKRHYLLAVISIAGPKLEGESPSRMAKFCIDLFADIGQSDEDALLEALLHAAGSIGPAIIRPVLDRLGRIQHDPSEFGEWFYLFSLLETVYETDDLSLRTEVIGFCREQLERASAGDAHFEDVTDAARILARVREYESRDLLARLAEIADAASGKRLNVAGPAFRDAVRILDDPSGDDLADPFWTRPIRELTENSVEWVNDYFRHEREARHRAERVNREADQLIEDFLQSNHAAVLEDKQREVADVVTAIALVNGAMRSEKAVGYLTEDVLYQVVMKDIPYIMPGDRPLYETIVPILQTLLAYLDHSKLTPEADRLSRRLKKWEKRIIDHCLDPRRWGEDKMDVIGAIQAGFDPHDEDQMNEYLRLQLNELMGQQARRISERSSGMLSEAETEEWKALEKLMGDPSIPEKHEERRLADTRIDQEDGQHGAK